MKRINRFKVSEFLRSLRGRAAGVYWVKKDGSLRVSNCRLGVNRTKGGTKTVGLDHDKYLTYWDFNRQNYRVIDLSSVIKIRANGEMHYIH